VTAHHGQRADYMRLGTTLILIENRMEGSSCGQVLGIILVFA